MKNTFFAPITPFIIAAAVALVGCDRAPVAPSPAEQAAILEGAPQVFVDGDETRGPSFVGIGDIYLGQPKEEALAQLAKICPTTMEYRAGESGGFAWFRGCVLEEPAGGLLSVRVGFWPELGDRVSTLDIKRSDVTLAETRERFRELVDQVIDEFPHPGLVEMRAKKYQMLADIDEGKDGPTHIAFGYTPKWADQMQADPSNSE
jgi:hypothetical protein